MSLGRALAAMLPVFAAGLTASSLSPEPPAVVSDDPSLTTAAALTNERPAFHYTLRCEPPGASCNVKLGDPIGITWNNATSAYEMFYDHKIGWGHARSRDFLRFTQLDDAISNFSASSGSSLMLPSGHAHVLAGAGGGLGGMGGVFSAISTDAELSAFSLLGGSGDKQPVAGGQAAGASIGGCSCDFRPPVCNESDPHRHHCSNPSDVCSNSSNIPEVNCSFLNDPHVWQEPNGSFGLLVASARNTHSGPSGVPQTLRFRGENLLNWRFVATYWLQGQDGFEANCPRTECVDRFEMGGKVVHTWSCVGWKAVLWMVGTEENDVFKMGGRKHLFGEHFEYKTDHFAKIGSGQT